MKKLYQSCVPGLRQLIYLEPNFLFERKALKWSILVKFLALLYSVFFTHKQIMTRPFANALRDLFCTLKNLNDAPFQPELKSSGTSFFRAGPKNPRSSLVKKERGMTTGHDDDEDNSTEG